VRLVSLLEGTRDLCSSCSTSVVGWEPRLSGAAFGPLPVEEHNETL
jgi:hypothetical protein